MQECRLQIRRCLTGPHCGIAAVSLWVAWAAGEHGLSEMPLCLNPKPRVPDGHARIG